MTSSNPPAMPDKPTARALAKARRATLSVDRRHALSAALVLFAGELTALVPKGCISGFLSIGDEIDVLPLMQSLSDQGRELALPVMRGRGQPLLFRHFRLGDDLAATTWGIREPLITAPVVQPALLLVPLLAFDAKGHRLGYGGGFYDRTLERLRRPADGTAIVTAIGVAFDEQRLDEVPHVDYDQKLDGTLTPTGLTLWR
jgi:5-formyltetrahydrofolate cyclo-ligase